MAGEKLVVLAGGISSRMKKPLDAGTNIDEALIKDANLKAKAMIGVGKNRRPFLDFLLYNARESGYTDILMVIGEKDDSIREYYGKKDSGNDFYGLKISYATQTIPAHRDKPLGTADALYQGLKHETGWRGTRFTVCNSDNLYSVKAMKLMLRDDYRNAMIDYDRDALEFDKGRIERFAITFKDDEGFLVDIIEKPSESQIQTARGKNGSIGISMNIFAFQYDMIYPFLEKAPMNPVRREKELPDAVKLMINTHPKSLYAYPLSEHVPDLTSKTDILPVKQYLQRNYAHAAF